MSDLAREWENAGLVNDALVFKVALAFKRMTIRAGEYVFPARASIDEILDILAKGKPILRKIAIPEGLTVSDIEGLIESSPYLSGQLPPQRAPEGSLLPETYFFERGEDKTILLDRMKQAMSKKLAMLWGQRDPSLPLRDIGEWVTLASIVEKETAQETERARIAGVFINRLRRGMKLQTDPTVIYAITKGQSKLNRPITREDLAFDDPYNTYVYQGLPPGPIANPGDASLRAVLHPLQTQELYFVADGTGGHAFAKTLEEHNRNVAKYRKLKKN